MQVVTLNRYASPKGVNEHRVLRTRQNPFIIIPDRLIGTEIPAYAPPKQACRIGLQAWIISRSRYSGRGQGEGDLDCLKRVLTLEIDLTPTLSRSTGRGSKRQMR